jgi:hypothetical protein
MLHRMKIAIVRESQDPTDVAPPSQRYSANNFHGPATILLACRTLLYSRSPTPSKSRYRLGRCQQRETLGTLQIRFLIDQF